MSEEIDDKLRDKAWTKQDEYFREGNVRLVGAAQKAVNSALWLERRSSSGNARLSRVGVS